MKVLIAGNTVLTFSPLGGDKLIGLDGTTEATAGVVTEMSENIVKAQAAAAIKRDVLSEGESVPFGEYPTFAFITSRELMGDLRKMTKLIGETVVGTEATYVVRGSRISLSVPEGAKPDYTQGLAVGSTIVVSHNISPRTLMNARGKVVAVNGTKVSVELDEGDARRLAAATGKNFAKVNLPKECVEVLA